MAIKTDYVSGDVLYPEDVNDANKEILRLREEVGKLTPTNLTFERGIKRSGNVVRADVDTSLEDSGIKLTLPSGSDSQIGISVDAVNDVEGIENEEEKVVTAKAVAEALTWGTF